jgi:hypothetical protein
MQIDRTVIDFRDQSPKRTARPTSAGAADAASRKAGKTGPDPARRIPAAGE